MIIVLLTLLVQCLWKEGVERWARLQSHSRSAARSLPIDAEKVDRKRKEKDEKGDEAEAPAQGSQGPLRLSPVGMAPVEQRAPAQPPRDQRGDARCRGSAAASTAPTDGYGTGRDDSSRAASIPKLV